MRVVANLGEGVAHLVPPISSPGVGVARGRSAGRTQEESGVAGGLEAGLAAGAGGEP